MELLDKSIDLMNKFIDKIEEMYLYDKQRLPTYDELKRYFNLCVTSRFDDGK